jgi:hypothetical protein
MPVILALPFAIPQTSRTARTFSKAGTVDTANSTITWPITPTQQAPLDVYRERGLAQAAVHGCDREQRVFARATDGVRSAAPRGEL